MRSRVALLVAATMAMAPACKQRRSSGAKVASAQSGEGDVSIIQAANAVVAAVERRLPPGYLAKALNSGTQRPSDTQRFGLDQQAGADSVDDLVNQDLTVLDLALFLRAEQEILGQQLGGSNVAGAQTGLALDDSGPSSQEVKDAIDILSQLIAKQGSDTNVELGKLRKDVDVIKGKLANGEPLRKPGGEEQPRERDARKLKKEETEAVVRAVRATSEEIRGNDRKAISDLAAGEYSDTKTERTRHCVLTWTPERGDAEGRILGELSFEWANCFNRNDGTFVSKVLHKGGRTGVLENSKSPMGQIQFASDTKIEIDIYGTKKVFVGVNPIKANSKFPFRDGLFNPERVPDTRAIFCPMAVQFYPHQNGQLSHLEVRAERTVPGCDGPDGYMSCQPEKGRGVKCSNEWGSQVYWFDPNRPDSFRSKGLHQRGDDVPVTFERR